MILDTTVDLGHVAETVRAQPSLDQLIEEFDQHNAAIKIFEEVESFYKAEIKARLEAAGFQPGQAYTLESGVGILYTSRTTPKSISREKLVLASVDPAVIDAATIGGVEGTPFVQIQRPRKQRSDQQGRGTDA